jgi:HEAT repeat protein
MRRPKRTLALLAVCGLAVVALSASDAPTSAMPPPKYFAPDPPFPLAGELAAQEKAATKALAAEQPPAVRREELRYDGKSFAAWQAAARTARTELKVERSTEIVQAMEAFGARGYGEEAAAIVLEVGARFVKRPPNEAFDEQEEKLLTYVCRAFQRIGAPAALVLAQALRDPRPEVREMAFWGLHEIKSCPRQAAPALARLVPNQDTAIFFLALKTLAQLEGPGKSLGEVLEEEGRTKTFVVALANALARPEPKFPSLAGRKWKPDLDVYSNAGWILEQLGPQAHAAVPVLLRLLKRKDWSHRRDVAKFLGMIHAEPRRVVPALVEALEDASEDVQYQAVSSLLQFGPHAKSAAVALRKLAEARTKTPAAESRTSATPDNPSEKAKSPNLKFFAALAVDQIEGGHTTSERVLLGMLRDLPKAEDRRSFLYNLDYIGDAVRCLKRATHDPDAAVRQTATDAVNIIAQLEKEGNLKVSD